MRGSARIVVEDLSLGYPVRGRQGRRGARVRAVDGVSLAIGAGETLSLVGESGCGKSSLGRALVRLREPDAGRVLYRARDGEEPVDVTRLVGRRLRAVRRELQIVFQDPLASLNPRLRAGEAVAEVLRVHGSVRGVELERGVERLFDEVGLDGALGRSLPRQLSGGQRQRVALARALAARPRVLVCDEITASLDVTVQARVLELLRRLQDERGLSYLFITHDLAVVRALGGRVAVMYLGRIVETGTVAELFDAPRHPYTRALLAAGGFGAAAEEGAPPVALAGEPPSAVDPPPGCAFHPRCPIGETECAMEVPREVRLSSTHRVACRLVEPPRVASPAQTSTS